LVSVGIYAVLHDNYPWYPYGRYRAEDANERFRVVRRHVTATLLRAPVKKRIKIFFAPDICYGRAADARCDDRIEAADLRRHQPADSENPARIAFHGRTMHGRIANSRALVPDWLLNLFRLASPMSRGQPAREPRRRRPLDLPEILRVLVRRGRR
jgi:hypothetical protein